MRDLEKEMAAKLWWKQLLPNVLWCMCEMAHRNHSFSFKSNLLGISFGTRTSKSDLLQKITKMVVECSCVVKKIVGKDARRRKTTLPRWVCTLPIITHFSSAGSLWIHNLSGKSLVFKLAIIAEMHILTYVHFGNNGTRISKYGTINN